MSYKIPFTRVTLTGKESSYIQQALTSLHLQGDGPFAKKCEQLLESVTGSKRVLLTSSGSDALEMAVLLAGIQPGDEVIMPSFTFVSTANAVVLRGGVPVFVDVRADTLNIDVEKVKQAVTERTKAIMPVHYAGLGCEMDQLKELARSKNLLIIEDAAHGCGAFYKGKHLGAIGDVGMLSFHQTKNIAAGEGGCLLINREDWIERSEILREKGTNRRKFLRGEVDKYTWVDIGSSFLPGELIAALLFAQLENLDSLNRQRVLIWNRYHEAFSHLEGKGFIQRPKASNDCVANGHKYFLLTESLQQRTELQRFFKERGIQAVSHFEPLHDAPAGKKYARCAGELKVTESVAKRILRLPLFADLSQNDQEEVITGVCDFYR